MTGDPGSGSPVVWDPVVRWAGGPDPGPRTPDRGPRIPEPGSFPDVTGLRIAHLIECDGPGGAERVVAHLATALQAAGAYNVAILPAHGEGWLGRELAGSGVAIEYFELNRPISPACARSLAGVFRRHDITVAHSHEFSMAVYGAWASWLAGVQHVITMHGSRYYAGRLQRRIAMRAAIAASSAVVAVSRNLAEHLRQSLWILPDSVTTVSNGVPRTELQRSTLREDLHLDADDRLLVAVGNLYPVKGHRHLIDAVALLADRHPNLHAAIAGRGDLDGALSEQAEALGLGDRVHLLGLRSDVAAVLAAADIVVHPSLAEGLPLALLEAMFAGRPIVASDVGEIGAALDGGRVGLLVEPGNPEALAAALDRLLTDSALARSLGAGAQSRAVDQYGVQQMVERYLSIYMRAQTV
jgi:glycosyltransferase involved in cell wall biosynthesis